MNTLDRKSGKGAAAAILYIEEGAAAAALMAGGNGPTTYEPRSKEARASSEGSYLRGVGSCTTQ